MAYNDQYSYDWDYHRRLELLVDLMDRSPDKPVRKLQWEALKYYPLSSKEAIRGWMKIRIAFLASDLWIKKYVPYEAFA